MNIQTNRSPVVPKTPKAPSIGSKLGNAARLRLLNQADLSSLTDMQQPTTVGKVRNFARTPAPEPVPAPPRTPKVRTFVNDPAPVDPDPDTIGEVVPDDEAVASDLNTPQATLDVIDEEEEILPKPVPFASATAFSDDSGMDPTGTNHADEDYEEPPQRKRAAKVHPSATPAPACCESCAAKAVQASAPQRIVVEAKGGESKGSILAAAAIGFLAGGPFGALVGAAGALAFDSRRTPTAPAAKADEPEEAGIDNGYDLDGTPYK